MLSLQDGKLHGNASSTVTATTNTGAENDHNNAPPVVAPAAQIPAVPAVQAPVLPVVEWLQWGVMARLILVAFLFTYNRNLNTEKLAHMAGLNSFVCAFSVTTYSFFTEFCILYL